MKKKMFTCFISLLLLMAFFTYANAAVEITDDLNDWSMVYSYSNTDFDDKNIPNFNNDTSRAKRKNTDSAEIVWSVPSITEFQAIGYHNTGYTTLHFNFYTSSNGENWDFQKPDRVEGGGSDDFWPRFTYTLSNLSDVNYVKIEWQEGGEKSWSQQLSQVTITTDAAPDSISLDQSEYSLAIGETLDTRTIAGYTGTNDQGEEIELKPDITGEADYSIDDETIATVDGNVITANDAGKTSLTAAYEGLEATADVEVRLELDSISLEQDHYSLVVNDTDNIAVTGEYTDGSQKDITESVSYTDYDDSIIEVDEKGEITALSVGNTTIDVSSEGITESVTVYVTDESGNATVDLGFNPTDDTYISSGDKDSSFGEKETLFVRSWWEESDPDNNAGKTQKGYLKFDLEKLSELQDLENINKATLKVYVTERQWDVSKERDFFVYGLDDDNWTEDELTYNNKPDQATDPITTIPGIWDTDQYYELDVTDFVIDQIEDDNLASFLLEFADGGAFHFASKENSDQSIIPELLIKAEGQFDLTPPDQPEGLQVVDTANTMARIEWSEVSGDDIAGYEIYVDSNYVGKTTDTSYDLQGLEEDQSYTVSVRAVNQLEIVSDPAEVSLTTGATGDYLRTIIDKNWTFDTALGPWDGETWDGYSAELKANPNNNDDNALALTITDSGQDKSDVGSLGLSQEELNQFIGNADAEVTFEFRRWQPAGGESFFKWRTTDVNDEKNYSDPFAVTTEAKTGEIEQIVRDGDDSAFASDGIDVEDLAIEFIFKGNGSLSEGETMYFDDLRFKVAVPSYEVDAPGNLTAETLDSNSVKLQWDESTHTFKEEYVIYRNGQEIGTTSDTHYEVDKLMPGVNYEFYVKLRNMEGLLSEESNIVEHEIEKETYPEYDNTLLWQLGTDDQSSAEFSNYSTDLNDLQIAADDYETTDDWSFMPKGLKLSENGTMNIKYNLDTVPEDGVEFSFRILDAEKAIPQMAVFSNEIMAGLIQIGGINGSNAVDLNGDTLAIKETYRLYIPQEMLKTGENVVTLKANRSLYAGSGSDSYTWWEWDHLKLEALGGPAHEPIHGRRIHMGTCISDVFTYSAAQIRHYPQITKWMGIAHSGNWMRISYWSDTQGAWNTYAPELLQTVKDLNIQPLINIWGGNMTNGSSSLREGNVPSWIRDYTIDFFDKYAHLMEYVELGNEPGVFDGTFKGTKALGEMFNELRPGYAPHLKLVAPGWAYWPSNGVPDGWARDPEMRREVEDYTDLTNGHSYNRSAVSQERGGALIETLLTYSDYDGDGLPKEMVMSEVGANDAHTDSGDYDTWDDRYAATFDREMRGHIGYADHIMHHAAYFSEGSRSYSLFDPNINWSTHQAEDTVAFVNPNDEDDVKLDTFRRLSLAYATHGTPLPYQYTNEAELAGKKAYFRPVDTSGLLTSTVGAESDKILLNFVNFENEELTMDVEVTMPESGDYIGERFGPGITYDEAYTKYDIDSAFNADPKLQLKETLAPGESVQYILWKPEEEMEAPTQVENLTIDKTTYQNVSFSWDSSTDNTEVAGYKIYRDGEDEPLSIIPRDLTSYNDADVEAATDYRYTVTAFDESWNESETATIEATTEEMPVTPVTSDGDGWRIEAEDCELTGSVTVSNRDNASGGKIVSNTHGGDVKIMNFDAPASGNYTITVNYGQGKGGTEKWFLVNDNDQGSSNFPDTGGWNTYKDMKRTIQLEKGLNTIAISGGGGVDIDYVILEEGEYVPQHEWQPSILHDSESILYSDQYTEASSGTYHVTETAGETSTFAFKGVGVRWYANIDSYSGTADVKIDGEVVDTIDLTNAASEGDDKLVFEEDGLEEGVHVLEIVANEDKEVTVSKFEYKYVNEETLIPASDLVVTDLSWEPAEPGVKEQVLFTATVKNIGLISTPDGVTTGISFSVDGGGAGFSDTYDQQIEPGETVEITANDDQYWTVPEPGTYTVEANADDINRYGNEGQPEMDRSNNKFSRELTVEEDVIKPGEPGKVELKAFQNWRKSSYLGEELLLGQADNSDISDLWLNLSELPPITADTLERASVVLTIKQGLMEETEETLFNKSDEEYGIKLYQITDPDYKGMPVYKTGYRAGLSFQLRDNRPGMDTGWADDADNILELFKDQDGNKLPADAEFKWSPELYASYDLDTVKIDVTDTVKDWLEGASKQGWFMTTDDNWETGDLLEFYDSKAKNKEVRPYIELVYQEETIGNCPDKVVDLTLDTYTDSSITIVAQQPDYTNDISGIKIIRTIARPAFAPWDGEIVYDDDGEDLIDGSGYSFTDEELENRTPYYYTVYTFNEAGVYSEGESILAIPGLPEAPANVNINKENGVAEISWDPLTDAEGYLIYRITGDRTIEVGPVEETNYIDKSLDVGTYEYQIAAVIDGIVGEKSNTATLTMEEESLVEPDVPDNFAAEAIAGREIELSWNKVNASTYLLERREAGTDDWTEIQIPSYELQIEKDEQTGESSLVYFDSSLEPYRDYEYRLKASNSAGESDYTEEVSVDLELPVKVSNLEYRVISASHLHLEWENLYPENTVERVEVYEDGTKAWEIPLNSNSTSSYVTGLEVDKNYKIRVVTSNGSEEAFVETATIRTTEDYRGGLL